MCLSFIKNLNVNKIDTFEDIVALCRFVYNTVPHDNKKSEFIQDVKVMYHLYTTKKDFGWCHANASFLHLLINEFNRESSIYNYGIEKGSLTHVVVCVTIHGIKYLVDPYFARYYVSSSGDPLTYSSLMGLIAKGKYDKIHNKFIDNCVKEVKQGDYFVGIKPEDFYKMVFNSWIVCCDYKKIMLETVGTVNPLALLPLKLQETRVLKKVDGSPYLEFF